MTLSRTSRILLGFLLLILAAFLWVNFLYRDSGFGLPFLSAAPAPSPDGAVSSPQAPAVAPVPDAEAADEVEILDLPFLLDEPPPAQPAEPEPAPEGESAVPQEEARRATVNPFSPIIPRGGAQAGRPVQPPARQQPQVITEVPIPAGPAGQPRPAGAAQAQAPLAPAPAPVTPDASASSTLPRALPGGTLGGTPDLLRSAIGATEPPTERLGELAAIREPEETPADLEQAGERSAELSRPQPIGPGEDGQRQAPMPDQPPLAAGTSDLSRYLRNNNVRFTGSVIGPVSVGVFRSAETPAPIVISLGQTLPDTSIVLTDLRGQQAELTLGDNTQILTLELRR
ncbi:MAG TPA: hypothetical protein VF168_03175 [Trueperaceae bacterium]